MLKRDISTTNILIIAMSSMVGSGWLFAPFLGTQMAGANVLISWILAAVFITVLALPLCEIALLLPISGSLSTYPSLTHGQDIGLIFFCISWLSYVVTAPIETLAVLQYSSYFFPILSEQTSTTFSLSGWGYLAAFFILMFVTFINTLGIKLLAECSRYAGLLKFLIPSIAIVSLFYVSDFHYFSGSLGIHLSSLKDWENIFTALSTGGVIFAFMGFQNSLMLVGEVKRPDRILAIATLSAIALGFVFYFLLQLAFLEAVPLKYLVQGWSHLKLPDAASPLVGLTLLIGLSFITILILIDSCICPLGSAVIYTTATSRILYSMALNRYLPAFLLQLNKYKIPSKALIVNFIVSMLLFFPFPGWQKMAAFLSSIGLLGYSIGPVCFLAMRKLAPNQCRPFLVRMPRLVSYLGFYVCCLMLHWCGLEILWKLCVALIMGISIHILYKKDWYILKKPGTKWFGFYVFSLLIFSYLGPFGGISFFVFPFDLLVLFPVSAVILYFSQRCLCSIETFENHLKIIKQNLT